MSVGNSTFPTEKILRNLNDRMWVVLLYKNFLAVCILESRQTRALAIVHCIIYVPFSNACTFELSEKEMHFQLEFLRKLWFQFFILQYFGENLPWVVTRWESCVCSKINRWIFTKILNNWKLWNVGRWKIFSISTYDFRKVILWTLVEVLWPSLLDLRWKLNSGQHH